MAKNRAVFLDRDKTINFDPGYISDPDQVKLMPGAADGIRLMNKAGFVVVVVSNQSGVARGLVTEERLVEIHARMQDLLAEHGASLDGIYYCPYLDGPEAVVERFRRASELRKPEPGMLLRAAKEMHLSLAESWMVGDSHRDVEAGVRAGCRTILLGEQVEDEQQYQPDHIVGSLLDAARIIVDGMENCD